MQATEHASQATTSIQLSCHELQASIDFYQTLGFALERIRPADAPHFASMLGFGIRLEIHSEPSTAARTDYLPTQLQLSRVSDGQQWVVGRAGMQYRDLVPSRLGGTLIASHIRIPLGGPVPDYVHYHHVGFQLIYCHRGWVKVVYEDQGEPFIMQAGDAVLQPPTIRHRVLEASDGLEVIELSSPAEHDTWREHHINLPNPGLQAGRLYGGQQFLRFQSTHTPWLEIAEGIQSQESGIAQASAGAVDVRIMQLHGHTHFTTQANSFCHTFIYVLDGALQLDLQGRHSMQSGDAALIPARQGYVLQAQSDCRLLVAHLPI